MVWVVSNEDITRELNQLTETCKDGELGYLTAAESVHNSELASVFSEYSKQRRQFVRELEREVQRSGKADEAGTLGGTLFRGWIHLKAALTGGDGGAIVAACESGEEVAVGAYEMAVNSDSTGPARVLVEKQARQVGEAHAHMLRLKVETSAADFQHTD